MKKIRLIKDHIHQGVRYAAGTVLEMDDHHADYVLNAVVAEREAVRARAAEIPGTPENIRIKSAERAADKGGLAE